MNNLLKNPFKLLFPLAFIVGSIGVALFIPNLFGMESYPINFHRRVMLDIFMNLVITGFLFTALPQFTKTESIKRSELLISTTLLICAFIGNAYPFLFHGFMVCFYIYLLILLSSRLVTAKEKIPYSFYFLPMAILYAVIAEMFWLMPIPGMDEYARKFLYFGYFLGVIMGVGLRLIPGLLGHTDIVKKQRKNYESGKPITNDFKVLIILFNLQIISDVMNSGVSTVLFRFLFLLLPAVTMFKLHRRPKAQTWHAWGVWLAVWSIITGFIAIHLDPINTAHWIHLIFINGIVLLAFMIITRVTKAHNSLDNKKEDSKTLLTIILLTLFTGLTRASSFYMPSSYANHLAYAAMLLIILFIWLFFYLNKFKDKK
jgi:uncharacterized protein involved in response to NO